MTYHRHFHQRLTVEQRLQKAAVQMMIALLVMTEGMVQRHPDVGKRVEVADVCRVYQGDIIVDLSRLFSLPHLQINRTTGDIEMSRKMDREGLARCFAATASWRTLDGEIRSAAHPASSPEGKRRRLNGEGSTTAIMYGWQAGKTMRAAIKPTWEPGRAPKFAGLDGQRVQDPDGKPEEVDEDDEDEDDPMAIATVSLAGASHHQPLSEQIKTIWDLFGTNLFTVAPRKVGTSSGYLVAGAGTTDDNLFTTDRLYDAEALAAIFSRYWSVRQEDKWDLAFRCLFPETFKEKAKWNQGYKRMTYYEKLAELRLVVSDEQWGVIRRDLKREFNKLSWCIAAENDRVMQTKGWKGPKQDGGTLRIVLNPSKTLPSPCRVED